VLSDALSDATVLEEVLRMILEIVNSCLVAQIKNNPNLVSADFIIFCCQIISGSYIRGIESCQMLHFVSFQERTIIVKLQL
jgi:hypothetical protein